MQREPQTRRSPVGPGLQSRTSNFHVQSASAEPLLQRLDGVQKAGTGWRARCPSCTGRSRALSIAESEGRILVHCFAGCSGDDVLGAVGLRWSDLHPPRSWPQSPEERRRALRVMREAGWSAALATLAQDATVLHLAAIQLARLEPLTQADQERLALACVRTQKASLALVERDHWKPPYCYAPRALVTLRTAAVDELRRELSVAERELQDAEAALIASV